MKEFINGLDLPVQIAVKAGIAVVSILLIWVLTRVNKKIFSGIRKKRNGIHIPFIGRLISALITVLGVIAAVTYINGSDSVWKTLLSGTAVISAVVVFAAQDSIKDVLAGLMISMYHPFKLGDRIVLSDGTAGIVENMTMRHVVLVGIDTVRYVIPNSKINSMQLTNFSYEREIRSAQLRFSVGYDSDIELAKRVIERAVENSEYTVPGRGKEGEPERYGSVYFISFADSALIMAVTVYYTRDYTTETVIDDVNTRVRRALIENGIEIPYNYVNVVSVTDK